VLDTNVLMHDPTAIFRFEEHDIYLPMVVLEELDANKKGLSRLAQRAPGERFLDEIMRGSQRSRSTLDLRFLGLQRQSRQEPSSGAVLPDAGTLRGLPEGIPASAQTT